MQVNIDAMADFETGEAALHIAVRLAHIDLVELMLSRGAVVGATDFQGRTPLHLASTPELVRLLVSYMGDIFWSDSFGLSPVHTAIWRPDFDFNWVQTFCSPAVPLYLLRIRRTQRREEEAKDYPSRFGGNVSVNVHVNANVSLTYWAADPPLTATDALLVVGYLLTEEERLARQDHTPGADQLHFENEREIHFPCFEGTLEAAVLLCWFAYQYHYVLHLPITNRSANHNLRPTRPALPIGGNIGGNNLNTPDRGTGRRLNTHRSPHSDPSLNTGGKNLPELSGIGELNEIFYDRWILKKITHFGCHVQTKPVDLSSLSRVGVADQEISNASAKSHLSDETEHVRRGGGGDDDAKDVREKEKKKEAESGSESESDVNDDIKQADESHGGDDPDNPGSADSPGIAGDVLAGLYGDWDGTERDRQRELSRLGNTYIDVSALELYTHKRTPQQVGL